MPIDRVCHIAQKEVFSSEEYLDELDNLQAETAADLEEDLNYIRTLLKIIGGGTRWYNPNVDEGLEQLLSDFKVEHFTTSEDPARAGQHKDIHALSVYSSGNVISDANVRARDNFLLEGASADTGWIIHGRSGNNYDFIHIAPKEGGSFNWSKGLKIFAADGRVDLLYGHLRFVSPLSVYNLQIDLQQGYQVYSDNASPTGGTGSRLWVNAPGDDYPTTQTGMVLGPRAGSELMTSLRVRARFTDFEGDITYSGNLFVKDYRLYKSNLTDGLSSNKRNVLFFKVPYKVEQWDGTTWVDVTSSMQSVFASLTQERTVIQEFPVASVGDSVRYRVYFDLGYDTWTAYVARIETQHTDNYTISVEFSNTSDFSSGLVTIGPFTEPHGWDSAIDIPSNESALDWKRYVRFDVELVKTHPSYNPKLRGLYLFAESSVVWNKDRYWPAYTWDDKNRILLRYTGSETYPALGWDVDRDTGFFRPASGVIGVTVDGQRIASFRQSGVRIDTSGAALAPLEALHVSQNARIDGVTKTSVLSVGDFNRTTHYDGDGTLYRYNGEVYFTVDNNLYIRDSGGSSIFHFHTDQGRLGVNRVAPQRNLDVTGNARVSDTLEVGNFANLGTTSSGNIYVAGEYHGTNRSGEIRLTGDWRHLVYYTSPGTTLEFDTFSNSVIIRGANARVKIRTRIPISFYSALAGYVIADDNNDGRFYTGAICLDENYNELSNDGISTYHYFIALGKQLNDVNDADNISGGIIAGFNSGVVNPPEGESHYRFESNTKYVDIVIIANYTTTTANPYTRVKEIVIKHLDLDKLYVLSANEVIPYNDYIRNALELKYTSTNGGPVNRTGTYRVIASSVIPPAGQYEDIFITLLNLINFEIHGVYRIYISSTGASLARIYSEVNDNYGALTSIGVLGLLKTSDNRLEISYANSRYDGLVAPIVFGTGLYNFDRIGAIHTPSIKTVSKPIIKSYSKYYSTVPAETTEFTINESLPGAKYVLGAYIDKDTVNGAGNYDVQITSTTHSTSGQIKYMIQRFSSVVSGGFLSIVNYIVYPQAYINW